MITQVRTSNDEITVTNTDTGKQATIRFTLRLTSMSARYGNANCEPKHVRDGYRLTLPGGWNKYTRTLAEAKRIATKAVQS